MSKCKRQAGVEHETIAFPHFRSCASCLLYVGLDHLPLHGRRQLVLRFVVCVHPQNFSLCSKNSGNYVYNVKNCRLALQGSPTVSLEANPLTYNMASLLCSPHVSLKRTQKKRYLPRWNLNTENQRTGMYKVIIYFTNQSIINLISSHLCNCYEFVLWVACVAGGIV